MNNSPIKVIVEKILRNVSPRFDKIVVAIEESKDLVVLKVEELQGSHEAHEQRLSEGSVEKKIRTGFTSSVQ